MSTLKEICKEQTELLNECHQNIKELTEENEKLERENECEKEWFYKYSCELEHIVKYERDTVKRLERENEKLVWTLKNRDDEKDWLERENNNLKQSVSEYKDYAESHVANYLELKSLEHENKALRLQVNTYFDEWQNEKLTSQGLREQCKEYAQDASKYTTLTNHIRNMKFASPYSYNYIHLVNFIKELERVDDGV